MGQKQPKPIGIIAKAPTCTNKKHQAALVDEAINEKANIYTACWVPSEQGRIPKGAVKGGWDSDGGTIFVGRIFHNRHLLPAKICPNQKCAISGFDGKEVISRIFEVLVCDDYSWKQARDGYVPKNALSTGETPSGETMYVGRAPWNGTLTPGKVQPSFGCLLIPWGGAEVPIREYAVLTVKSGSNNKKRSHTVLSDKLGSPSK